MGSSRWPSPRSHRAAVLPPAQQANLTAEGTRRLVAPPSSRSVPRSVVVGRSVRWSVGGSVFRRKCHAARMSRSRCAGVCQLLKRVTFPDAPDPHGRCSWSLRSERAERCTHGPIKAARLPRQSCGHGAAPPLNSTRTATDATRVSLCSSGPSSSRNEKVPEGSHARLPF